MRKNELVPYRPVWLTKEAHDILKKEKRKQKKTMMRLVDDLVNEKYNQPNDK